MMIKQHWRYGWLVVVVTLVALGLTRTSGPPTQREALLGLGWRLLADQRLAADGRTSCLTCHQPAQGYTDGRPRARPGGLNTPPLWELDQRRVYGWRQPGLASLEAAALRPLADPAEQGPLDPATLERLRSDPDLLAAYQLAFPMAEAIITWEQTALALAAAMRTISPPPPDAHLLATPAALRGQALFAELGCRMCHQGANFSSDSYHSVGIAPPGAPDRGRVRVPSLRGLALTAPYFHDGSAPTLEAVVRHYAAGGQEQGGVPSAALVPFQLSEQELADLVAFLRGL
ncbi:MAG: cytochrome-c peroxidase [Oscillochloridaceae bacterium umkhey_bin13]